jgi:hemerythrin-like domain-containing protein
MRVRNILRTWPETKSGSRRGPSESCRAATDQIRYNGKRGKDMEPISLAALLAVHRVLDELFFSHQEALLNRDLPAAAARLKSFEHLLADHVWDEEDVLLPVYGRAGTIPGGPPALFTGEHKRLQEMLSDFNNCLASLAEASAAPTRGILWLFDREATFKNLMTHHHLREANIFYPALDRVTSEAERRELLARCHIAREADPNVTQ